MAWQDDAIMLLRNKLGDVCTQEYSDTRLEELLFCAAYLVNEEVDLSTDYTITLSSSTISPDPTDDSSFIHLMVVKAAATIACGEARKLAMQAYRVVDGPSSIDLGGAYKAAKEMCDSYSNEYLSMVVSYTLGTSNVGKAVLSPYTYDGIAGRFI